MLINMFGEKNKKRQGRIFFYTQYFYPEPTIKGLKFIEELSKDNYEVQVITAFPNYPFGKIYKPYKLSIFKREIIGKIKINRLYVFPNHSKSVFLRFINYFSFAISSFLFCLLFVKKEDILYVYQPPPTLGIFSSLIKFLKKTKFILDIQDLWPETLIQNSLIKNKYLIYIISKICMFSYSNANYIITNSNGFKNTLIKKGIRKEKISTIYNGAI